MRMTVWSRIEEMYGIKIRETVKVHDVYRLRTAEANYCFKRYLFPEEVVRFITRVFCCLDEHGFERSQRLCYTAEQSPYLAHEGLYYTLTNWVEGQRPDFHNRSDFKTAIRTLAKFHLKAQGFPAEEATAARYRYAELQPEVWEYRALLSQHQTTVRLVPLCDETLFHISQPNVIQAVASELTLSAFVHGDYNYPNLIRDDRHKLHLIDFENT